MASKEETDQEKRELKEQEALGMKKKPEVTKVPPDGGWGWVIVGASALSNFIIIPIMQSFGLLFQDAFIEYEMTPTDLSVIINVNSAFGMGLGLLNGPLLRRYGYRKIAISGSIMTFLGITITSWATSFTHFLISYSLITAAGSFLLMSSFSLALNTYFRERRGRASGFSAAFMGLGPVFMPQIITFLLKRYSIQGTTLILASLSLHSLFAALLLQPVKWHMKTVTIEEEVKYIEMQPMVTEEEKTKPVLEPEEPRKRTRTNTINSTDAEYDHDVDTHSMYGFETPLLSHRTFGSSQHVAGKRKLSAVSYNRSISQVEDGMQRTHHPTSTYSWWESLDSINLGSSVKIFDERPYVPLRQDSQVSDRSKKEKTEQATVPTSAIKESDTENINNNNNSSKKIDNEDIPEPKKKKGVLKRVGLAIVKFFDLDLLRDPGYVILMLGMSIATCAELNFSLFTPMILADYAFDKDQIATVMSTIGIADIIFRFLAPFVGDCLKLRAQTMYLIALLMLIASRTTLMLFHTYHAALAVAVALGVAKGFRTVYWGVVIPSYVPLERLASASGLQSVVNAFFTIASIPLMASVRDFTGSYNMCIAALNCLTLITVCMWTAQIVHRMLKARKSTT